MSNIKFDSVIMLTWSDWDTEARSNRYHYASRFSKICPVFFIQVNSNYYSVSIEQKTFENLYIIKLPPIYSKSIMDEINAIVSAAGCKRSLLWTYNSNFGPVLSYLNYDLAIYHGTEAYLSYDAPFFFEKTSKAYSDLMKTFTHSDLLIAVSQGVADSYQDKSSVSVPTTVISNGCDYHFFAPSEDVLQKLPAIRSKKKRILYQGTIYNKIDYPLLHALIRKLKDWDFIFCGVIPFVEQAWLNIIKEPNVQYLGNIPIEQVREQMYLANVGIIPFQQLDFLIKRSLPLKAFEYLACGLPTVTVPIHSLRDTPDAFLLANTLEEFASQINKAYELSTDISYLNNLISTAKLHDYDTKFEQALKIINQAYENKRKY